MVAKYPGKTAPNNDISGCWARGDIIFSRTLYLPFFCNSCRLIQKIESLFPDISILSGRDVGDSRLNLCPSAFHLNGPGLMCRSRRRANSVCPDPRRQPTSAYAALLPASVASRIKAISRCGVDVQGVPKTSGALTPRAQRIRGTPSSCAHVLAVQERVRFSLCNRIGLRCAPRINGAALISDIAFSARPYLKCGKSLASASA